MKHLFILVLLISISFDGFTQFSREQAIELVVNEIVGANNLQTYYTYGRYLDMMGGDTLWMEDDTDYLICPYDKNWVFFIDLEPLAFWVHPCQIVFVNKETGEYEKIVKEWPPVPFISNQNLFFEGWEWILSIGSEEIDNHNIQFKLFPNPTSRFLYIKLHDSSSKNYQIKIFNFYGTELLHFSIQKNQQKSFCLDINQLPSGIYILRLETNGSDLFVRKIIIQH